MIVRQFINWVRSAPAGERADATSALARAYLYSDLSEDDRIAAEGAMTMLLDDPSPLVRQALADALAPSAKAPATLIIALAADQPDVASGVLEFSPLLIDADLLPHEVTWRVRLDVASVFVFRSVRRELPALRRPVIGEGNAHIDLGARDQLDGTETAQRAAALPGVLKATPSPIRGRLRRWSCGCDESRSPGAARASHSAEDRRRTARW